MKQRENQPSLAVSSHFATPAFGSDLKLEVLPIAFLPRQLTGVAQSEDFLRPATLFLALVTASAVWVESDAYRYGAGALLICALVHYFRLPTVERPAIGWVAWACFGWVAYIALRYGWSAWQNPQARGSAEGIYFFPLVFPTMGYALFVSRKRLRGLDDLFILVSAVMLAATIDFGSVFDGERTPFLIHNNTIHASVGAGLIAICALGYAEHAYRNEARRSRTEQSARVILACTVIALCMIGVFGAKSKGVWLALGLTMPIYAATCLVQLPRRQALIGSALALAAFAVLVYFGSAGMIHELEPFSASGFALFDAVILDGFRAVRAAIASGAVPFSFNERLMLWSNAFEIISVYPVFGPGIAWSALWSVTSYTGVPYNLMHNGYLEIAIRYGMTGLIFLIGLYAVFLIWLVRARRRDLVSLTSFKIWLFSVAFFSITLLTNSNNRLAIGESFILISAGYAFAAYYTLFQPKVD